MVIRILCGMLLATSLVACTVPGSPTMDGAVPVSLHVDSRPVPLADEPQVRLAPGKRAVYLSVVPGGTGYSLYFSLLADQPLSEGFSVGALRAAVLELNQSQDGRVVSWRTSPDSSGLDGLTLESTQGRLTGRYTATLQPLPGNPQGPQAVDLRFDTPYPVERDPLAEP